MSLEIVINNISQTSSVSTPFGSIDPGKRFPKTGSFSITQDQLDKYSGDLDYLKSRGLITWSLTDATSAVSISDEVAAIKDPTYEVLIPSKFPATGVKFYYGSAGYTTSFRPERYVATWGVTRTIYVNVSTGNDSSGTGTSGAPYKTLAKAFAIIQAGPDVSVQVTVQTNNADVVFARDESTPATPTISGKRIYITPDSPGYRIYITTAQRSMSWTLSGGQTVTYQANRTSVTNVVDVSNKDQYGIPKAYVLKTSIAEVEATPGSWWQNAGIVYMHTLTGVSPVEGTHLTNVALTSFTFSLANAAELFLRNVYFLGTGSSGTVLATAAAGDHSNTKLVAYNCAFCYSNYLNTADLQRNGLGLDSIKVTQIYNSIAAYNSGDGFNFHYTDVDDVRQCYALAFNCISYDNGLQNTNDTNNAFTAHEGVNFLGIGCMGDRSKGPLYAFVNGCYIVLRGCVAKQSMISSTAFGTHTGYYFDNSLAPAGVRGEADLDDCTSNNTIWDLNTDASGFKVILRRFNGSKIPTSIQQYITYMD